MAEYEASLSKKEAVAGIPSLLDAAFDAFVDAARKELGNKGGGIDPKVRSRVLDDALRRAREEAK